MQETFFNELSLKTGKLDYSCWKNIIKLQSYLRNYDFTVCRISSAYREQLKKSLDDLESQTPSFRTIKSVVYSFFHTEYDPIAIESNEKLAGDFLSHDITYNKEKAIGLAWANYCDTFALSFLTSDQWNKAVIEIEKDGLPNVVHHASVIENINQNLDWIEARKPVELQKTSVLPRNKKFHLREDHGNDVLTKFWKKIRNCEYIEACINSLDWKPSQRSFIREIFSDGVIHITIPWDDRGLGMAIQTTGRNLRETEKIARILIDKYSGGK